MSYNLKVWRNPPGKFKPTVDENVTVSKLVEWLMILVTNIQAKSAEPLVQRVEISKVKRVKK